MVNWHFFEEPIFETWVFNENLRVLCSFKRFRSSLKSSRKIRHNYALRAKRSARRGAYWYKPLGAKGSRKRSQKIVYSPTSQPWENKYDFLKPRDSTPGHYTHIPSTWPIFDAQNLVSWEYLNWEIWI